GILEEICNQVDEKGIEGAYGYIVGNLLPDFLLCFVGVGELNMAAKAAKATEAAEKARSTKWGRGAAAGAKTSGEAAKLRGFGRFGELIADFGEWNKLPVFVTPEGFTMKGDAAGRFFADFKEFRQVKNAERMAAVDDIAAGGKKLTGPSKTPDPHAKPTGNPEKIDPKWNEQKIRGIEAENETAEIFAKNGYEIEQRPKVLESDGVSLDKKPDYTIIEEGVRAAKAAGEPVAQNIINLASKDFASTDMKMFRLSNELTGIADLLINDFTGVGTQKHTAR
ncbi:MAG: hypothetical protein FWF88_13475, partial [Peptococcaceae bacterium]|nr:hypothetical protein [Peptococcaceae bacterium]